MAAEAPVLVVLGAGGQLGRALAEISAPTGWSRREFRRAEVDISDPAAIAAALDGIASGVVVNAAAYTAVDRAETEAEAAFAINRDGAGNVAEAAARAGLAMVHFSTDYVFDGEKRTPYEEDDATGPVSVYGASKLAGEATVREATSRAVILRTTWLFGVHGANFLRTMFRLGCERDQLRVVDDQIGCPTAASDLARIVVALAPRLEGAAVGDPAFGTFHCCGDESVSWHGFAAAILGGAAARGAKVAALHPIPTSEYPLPARRPAYSVLSCAKLAAVHGLDAPSWRHTLDGCLATLLEES